jgi:hypothetical protein
MRHRHLLRPSSHTRDRSHLRLVITGSAATGIRLDHATTGMRVIGPGGPTLAHIGLAPATTAIGIIPVTGVVNG